MVLARPQTQFDQRPRVRHRLALPSIVGLIAAHGRFAGLIPGAGSFSAQIMLADQGFLDGLRSLGINFLLAADTLPARAFSLRGRMRAWSSDSSRWRNSPWFLRSLWATVSVATGLVASVSPGELARAFAAEKAQAANTQIAVNPTLRISVQTLNAKTFDFKMKSPTRRWPCNHPRLDVAMPVFVGLVSVTEVYPPERWFHPAAMNLGTAPGTQRPGRSSCSTRSGRILPRC